MMLVLWGYARTCLAALLLSSGSLAPHTWRSAGTLQCMHVYETLPTGKTLAHHACTGLCQQPGRCRAGITRERLESFDRAIKVEPEDYPDKRSALIAEFRSYLGILKARAALMMCPKLTNLPAQQ